MLTCTFRLFTSDKPITWSRLRGSFKPQSIKLSKHSTQNGVNSFEFLFDSFLLFFFIIDSIFYSVFLLFTLSLAWWIFHFVKLKFSHRVVSFPKRYSSQRPKTKDCVQVSKTYAAPKPSGIATSLEMSARE